MPRIVHFKKVVVTVELDDGTELKVESDSMYGRPGNEYLGVNLYNVMGVLNRKLNSALEGMYGEQKPIT
jgi:hypothetical protein